MKTTFSLNNLCYKFLSGVLVCALLYVGRKQSRAPMCDAITIGHSQAIYCHLPPSPVDFTIGNTFVHSFQRKSLGFDRNISQIISILTFRLATLPFGELDVRIIAASSLNSQLRLERFTEQPGGNVGIVDVAKNNHADLDKLAPFAPFTLELTSVRQFSRQPF